MSRFKELFAEVQQDESPAPPKTEQKLRTKKVTPIVQPPMRTKGRRSDPSYTGAFAYIPAQLHEDVKRQLFGRKDLDFSGLVEQLLAEWLKKQK